MGNEQHSITTYLSDMIAVERHIREPFETQSKDGDVPKYAGAQPITQQLCDISQRHIDELKAELERQGGHEASPIKSAFTEALGAAASAIDKVRKTKVSKMLRDDYTALSLANASYSALLATANAMGFPSVAQLAERFLRDYAECVMSIGTALPAIVVQELRETGLDVDETTIGTSVSAVVEAWRSNARSQQSSSYGEIGSGSVTGAARQTDISTS